MKRVSNQPSKHTAVSQSFIKKIWRFLWYEDSIWSWIANIIVAFVLIKFIVYPALSFILSTSLPIVAVVSGSMEHKVAPICDKYLANGLCFSYSSVRFDLCGNSLSKGESVNLTNYWKSCGNWYESRNISLNSFQSYDFSSGFNTGDVMVVRGKPWQSLQIGDVIVWIAADGTPIIHRVVEITTNQGVRTVSTKGDHNADQITGGIRSELKITQAQYAGTAVLRIPYLGYVKLWAARAIGYLFA